MTPSTSRYITGLVEVSHGRTNYDTADADDRKDIVTRLMSEIDENEASETIIPTTRLAKIVSDYLRYPTTDAKKFQINLVDHIYENMSYLIKEMFEEAFENYESGKRVYGNNEHLIVDNLERARDINQSRLLFLN